MSKLTRRDIIKGSLATVAGAGAVASLPTSTWSQPLGANDDIRVAVVGFNSKGKGHIEGFRKMDGVRVVALCDADQAVVDREVGKFTNRQEKVDAYTDIRKMLEDDNIDAVVTATPNHWHSLVTVWSCQAGKHVYVEKPVSHNVLEGRKAYEAARKYGCIVQTGTQNRSDFGRRDAIQWMHEGNLGKIKVIRGFCYKRRASIGKVDGPQTPPSTVDYDLWCGPAPKVPLMRKRFHYDWHWIWDTGCGDLGNQGIHEMDVCRWAHGANELSPRVMSIGGRFGYIDDGETPNTQIVIHDYPDYPIIFEVRGLPISNKEGYDKAMPHYRGVRIGNVFECEGGYIAGGKAYDYNDKEIKQFKNDGGGKHAENFIKAVRSGKREDLNADILEGHLSSALCHTGNISHRLGQEVSNGEVMEVIKGASLATETYERFQEHLGANGIDLKKSDVTLGPWLEMNGKKEVFKGEWADKANKLLTREYREPFVVPDKV